LETASKISAGPFPSIVFFNQSKHSQASWFRFVMNEPRGGAVGNISDRHIVVSSKMADDLEYRVLDTSQPDMRAYESVSLRVRSEREHPWTSRRNF